MSQSVREIARVVGCVYLVWYGMHVYRTFLYIYIKTCALPVQSVIRQLDFQKPYIPQQSTRQREVQSATGSSTLNI